MSVLDFIFKVGMDVTEAKKEFSSFRRELGGETGSSLGGRGGLQGALLSPLTNNIQALYSSLSQNATSMFASNAIGLGIPGAQTASNLLAWSDALAAGRDSANQVAGDLGSYGIKLTEAQMTMNSRMANAGATGRAEAVQAQTLNYNQLYNGQSTDGAGLQPADSLAPTPFKHHNELLDDSDFEQMMRKGFRRESLIDDMFRGIQGHGWGRAWR